MKPFDYAKNVVPLNIVGKMFVVSLANTTWRLNLCLTPSAQRADEIALLGRQIIALEIARALRNEDCRMAAEIDDAWLTGRIWAPSQASRICRELAELHTVELHSTDGQTDRRQPAGNSESAAPSGRNG